LINVDGRWFEDKHGGYDPKQVLGFLRGYQAMHPAAQTLLNKALSAGQKNQRPLLLIFNAPSSVPSPALDTWLDTRTVRSMLAQNVVTIQIDVDRSVGGNEMLHRYTGSWRRTVPWLVVVDSKNGAVLAAGGAREGAAAPFPEGEQDVDRMREILRTACKNLTADQIDLLLSTLQPSISDARTADSTTPAGPTS